MFFFKMLVFAFSFNEYQWLIAFGVYVFEEHI